MANFLRNLLQVTTLSIDNCADTANADGDSCWKNRRLLLIAVFFFASIMASPQATHAATSPGALAAIISTVLLDDTTTLSPEQTLIERYYQAILGRASDANGLAFWTNEVNRARNMGLDIKDVFRVMANVFFTSTEYLNRATSNTQYVTDLYRTFFNRDPNSSELATQTQSLTDGLPRSVVLFDLLFSSEFSSAMQSLFGDTTARSEAAAVGDFYRGFLNRLPDDAGFAFWLGRFRTAQCTNATAVRTEAESISSQFLVGAEYTNRQRNNRDFIADLYYAFLRRGGDLGGFNYWVNRLNSATRDQVRQAFVNSTEFQTRVSQIISQGCFP